MGVETAGHPLPHDVTVNALGVHLWVYQVKQAREWYEKASELGDSGAAFALGVLYETQLYNRLKAQEWYGWCGYRIWGGTPLLMR